jgi:hypothetical protein
VDGATTCQSGRTPSISISILASGNDLLVAGTEVTAADAVSIIHLGLDRNPRVSSPAAFLRAARVATADVRRGDRLFTQMPFFWVAD